MCWAGKNITDGKLPCGLLRRLAWRCHDPAIAVAELVASGVWDEDGQNGWIIHDFLEYNPSKADAETLAATRSEAGKAGAMARWQSHSKTDGKRYGKSDGKTMPPSPTPTPSPSQRDEGLPRPPAAVPVYPQEPADPEYGAALSKLEALGMVRGDTKLDFDALWPDLTNGRREWVDDAVKVALSNEAYSPSYAVSVLRNAVAVNKRPGQARPKTGARPQGHNLRELLRLDEDD
jgi:hypothetical protein